MKNVFVRFAMFILVLALLSASTSAYAQSAQRLAPALTKELLTAKWTTGSEEYILGKDGASIIKADGRECPGTWVLDGKTLTINPKKLMYKKDDPCSKTRVLTIISVNPNGGITLETADRKQIHLTRQQ